MIWTIATFMTAIVKGTVGTVGSIMNFVNNLAGIVAPIVAGIIFDRTGSFAANFLVAGIILIIGILCYLFLLGRIEQIQAPSTEVPFAEAPLAPKQAS